MRICACTEISCSYLCVVSGRVHVKTLVSWIINLAFSTANALVSKDLSRKGEKASALRAGVFSCLCAQRAYSREMQGERGLCSIT